MRCEVQAGELERRRAIAMLEPLVEEIVDSSLDPAIPVPEYETLLDAIRSLQSGGDRDESRGKPFVCAAAYASNRANCDSLSLAALAP